MTSPGLHQESEQTAPDSACCPQCGGPKSANAMRCYACAWPGRLPKATNRQAEFELAVPVSPILSRRKVKFRVYCFSCGRSTEVEVAPSRMGRCDACGGTMLVELGDSD